jgi:hypothetical protein
MQHIHIQCVLTGPGRRLVVFSSSEQTRPNTQLLACGAAISVLRTSTVSVREASGERGVTLWHLSPWYVHAKRSLQLRNVQLRLVHPAMATDSSIALST